MHWFGERQRAINGKPVRSSGLFLKLKSAAAVCCLLAGTAPGYAMGAGNGFGQAQAPAQTPANPAGAPNTQALPTEPPPNYTQPLYMRPQSRDFSKERSYWPNPLAPYKPTTAPSASFLNSPRLGDLIKDGKIYLSLSDAIMLALENNYDIAIQRFNLNIADTDILRTRSGALFLGINSGLVTGTLGGSGTTVTTGGGPGGTSVAAGGAGTGAGGLALTTNGGGT
jgi:outer membrane protein